MNCGNPAQVRSHASIRLSPPTLDFARETPLLTDGYHQYAMGGFQFSVVEHAVGVHHFAAFERDLPARRAVYAGNVAVRQQTRKLLCLI